MPTNAAEDLSVGSPGRDISALLKESSSTSYHQGVDPLELINHFFQTTQLLWMGSPQCQDLLQQYTPRLALGSSFLLHAMLAFSAYHLAVLRPEQRQHKIAGELHYSLALQSYGQALDDESVDADALFACCLLLTMLSFEHLSNDLDDGDNPKSQKSLALDTVGIRFIGGPRILAEAFTRRSMLNQGLWKPLTRHCEEYLIANDNILAGVPGASRSMAGLEAVCRGNEVSGPFETALTSLRLLMQCYVSDRQEMVECTFGFAIKLDHRFLRLVEGNAPKALLVMCYWYALVMQVNQWWACRTAQIEGIKLLRSLRDTADFTIQGLLDFPAELLNAQLEIFQTPIPL